MKHIYIFFLCCFAANSQIISFPDPVFKAKLLASDVTNNTGQKNIWPPVNGQTYANVKIDADDDGEITGAEASIVNKLNVQNSNISSLSGFEFFTQLEVVHCENNLLTSVDMGDVGSSQNTQFYMYCENNQLTSIDFSTLTRPLFLYANNNQFTGFDFTGFNFALVLECSNNPISEIETGDFHYLNYLECTNTPVTTINISGNYGCEIMNCNNSPNLTALMIKDAVDIDADMGDMWTAFNFMNCPNLQYLCVSESRLGQAQARLNDYGYTNCVVNAYCDFAPGSPFYTIQGNNKLDLGSNGCDDSDSPYPNLKYNITNGMVSGIIPSSSGNFSIPVVSGSHTITPILECPQYYTVSPPSLIANFPSMPSPLTQNFCIAPNGAHNDLEVVISSTMPARPGFDAHYIVACRNKGTVVQNAVVTFTFEDGLSDVVSAFPSATQSENTVTWNFDNLQPLETRNATVVLNINSPIETPAVNGGDVLHFSVSALDASDEMPLDNTMNLNQTVVNSFDPNDKTCAEGNIVGPEMIGQYVHYTIRFENTGSANAENIVVKDVIDAAKFDLASLVPLISSHPFITRTLTGNKVEFIFENINLPFDDANNDGYVAFKIKTKPTLAVGDTFSNTASIYFDYNFPIVTNTASTTIQLLGNPDFEFSNEFMLYPNPAENVLNIRSKNGVEVHSASIYNAIGQLLMTMTDLESAIDVSQLQSGNYFIKVYSNKGTAVSKFIKN